MNLMVLVKQFLPVFFVGGFPEIGSIAQYAGTVVFLMGFLVVLGESKKLEHSEVYTKKDV